MSMLDTYRNNLLRKREEAAKLNQDLAKEQQMKKRLKSQSRKIWTIVVFLMIYLKSIQKT